MTKDKTGTGLVVPTEASKTPWVKYPQTFEARPKTTGGSPGLFPNWGQQGYDKRVLEVRVPTPLPLLTLAVWVSRNILVSVLGRSASGGPDLNPPSTPQVGAKVDWEPKLARAKHLDYILFRGCPNTRNEQIAERNREVCTIPRPLSLGTSGPSPALGPVHDPQIETTPCL